ncbi:hypothetical protein JCM3765_004036 [Sporobolomyces pararoseus]
MSFSSLPPELIHFIISSTVPHTFHSLTYRERQSTLCRLALVSKLFHSIAQPLLLGIVKLKRTKDAMLPTPARVLGGGMRKWKVVPWLVIEWDDPTLDSATQEEEDRFAESLQLLATARNLTSAYFVPMDYPNLFSTMSQHLWRLFKFPFSAPPLSSLMPFSSLPPELVQQIIESTVPHTFHSTTYKQRQITLCRLSLVSKLFRSIAQPLLLEIVKFDNFEDMEKLPAARATEGDTRSRELIRWLVITEDDDLLNSVQSEEEEILEFLGGSASVTSLTILSFDPMGFEQLLTMTSLQLTSLHLSLCHWKEPSRTHLPNLRDLTLCSVSSELFDSLVDPATVPNLRNFAFINDSRIWTENRTKTKLDQFLPQLETLNVPAIIWLDPRAAFLHTAASRTLVDFVSYDAEQLDPSTASLKHLRIRHSSPRSSAFIPEDIDAHLDRWANYIQNNPSLSLKSIYLDSALRSLNKISSATKRRLTTLTRVCQDRKIDLVFETSPVSWSLDPQISEEFVRRQKEKSRSEPEDRGEMGRSTM